MSQDVLINVDNLVKHFTLRGGLFSRQVKKVRAVDGVSFSIKRGETLGLVGESGCGKTTLGRTILRLVPATSGKIDFEGKDILKVSHEEMRKLRRDMQIVFQDPYGSLDPRMMVGDIIGEPMIVHSTAHRTELRERVQHLMDVVGLSKTHYYRYPHEFSGGQRQRIGIARSLALNPKFIVCDEPVSALDVSIQSQILNLLKDLQGEFNLTYLFISHNLSVVKHVSDRIAVMYLGKIVELAPKASLYKTPLHPYSQALLSAVPVPNPKLSRQRIVLEGDVPNPINPPPGCRFNTRCPLVEPRCRDLQPELREVEANHYVACHVVQ